MMGQRHIKHFIVESIVFWCALQLSNTEPITYWIWSQGCRKLDSEVTLTNITGRTPAECFYNCGNKTLSIAIQDGECRCLDTRNIQREIAGGVPNVCDTCEEDSQLLCGNRPANLWSVYVKGENPGLRTIDDSTMCISGEYNGGEIKMKAHACHDKLPVLCYSDLFRECQLTDSYNGVTWNETSVECLMNLMTQVSLGELRSCENVEAIGRQTFWLAIRKTVYNTPETTSALPQVSTNIDISTDIDITIVETDVVSITSPQTTPSVDHTNENVLTTHTDTDKPLDHSSVKFSTKSNLQTTHALTDVTLVHSEVTTDHSIQGNASHVTGIKGQEPSHTTNMENKSFDSASVFKTASITNSKAVAKEQNSTLTTESNYHEVMNLSTLDTKFHKSGRKGTTGNEGGRRTTKHSGVTTELEQTTKPADNRTSIITVVLNSTWKSVRTTEKHSVQTGNITPTLSTDNTFLSLSSLTSKQGNSLETTRLMSKRTTTEMTTSQVLSPVQPMSLAQHSDFNEIKVYYAVFGGCMIVLLLIAVVYLAIINRSLRKLTRSQFLGRSVRQESNVYQQRRGRGRYSYLTDGSNRGLHSNLRPSVTEQTDQNRFDNYGYWWDERSYEHDDTSDNAMSTRDRLDSHVPHAVTVNSHQRPSLLHTGYTETGSSTNDLL